MFCLFAQRFHPDNKETGDNRRFREIHEAHSVLSNPEKRGPVSTSTPGKHRRNAGALISAGESSPESDFEMELMIRLTLLEALYIQAAG